MVKQKKGGKQQRGDDSDDENFVDPIAAARAADENADDRCVIGATDRAVLCDFAPSASSRAGRRARSLARPLDRLAHARARAHRSEEQKKPLTKAQKRAMA